MTVSYSQTMGSHRVSQSNLFCEDNNALIKIMKTTKQLFRRLDQDLGMLAKGATGLTKLAILVRHHRVNSPVSPGQASAVDSLPILWEAGGESAGTDSAGQRPHRDRWTPGNVAVVSGPSMAKDLAVTSYTSSGVFRWQNAVSPSFGYLPG